MVVNFNGGAMVARCVEHLLRTRWPADALEVLVVDNASTDGSADEVAERFPVVRVVRSPANLGLAGGANLGLADLEGFDHVALVNSDAFVEPDWLAPLVDALEADRELGAANAKILFEPRFVEVGVATEAVAPSPDDQRRLGVRVSGLRGDGVDGWKLRSFVDGFHFPEWGAPGEPVFRWSGPTGTIWAPVREPGPDGRHRVELRLAADRVKDVEVASGTTSRVVTVGTEPAWFEVDSDAEPFDVVNNAGSFVHEGGYGADRGFWHRDDGTFDEPAEVFAWCGAAVLLSRRYLDDVGLFDGDFFMYYEDFDLAWRGRSRGWRYRFVPGSVVRHLHSASSVEGSAFFDYHHQRNRLLTLVKNAPARLAAVQCLAFAGEIGRVTYGEVVSPALRRRPTRLRFAPRRARSGLGFLRRLPRALAARRRIGRRRTVPASEVFAWMEPTPPW